MNKNNINKLKLFFMGLESRFNENIDMFQSIEAEFKAGLKKFVGKGDFSESKISYNFSGITKDYSISELFQKILKDAEDYDELTFFYLERGSRVQIIANSKNVTMTSKEVLDDLPTEKKKTQTTSATTSTLLNRDYFINADKAAPLLKEIKIMTQDGKIKNDKIRKYNQIDHYIELLDGVIDKIPANKNITILDCGCGKSYLSFALNYYITEVKKRKSNFIGIDISPEIIETSKKIAAKLDYRNMEFLAMDINDFKPSSQINVVLSLHACDTATDMGLAIGVKVKADVIIAVPCCHKEVLKKYSYKPFDRILKQGVLKARMADILTDGMRTLLLEANGYDVSIVEYISPLETPKNLMIRAFRTGKENEDAMDEFMSLMLSLNVAPSLYSYLYVEDDFQ
ncbi:class I SAM-dependent methyltransferase [Clostridium grantii]|uniref:Methyltransferase domain-containing protein n=1 Tax=Clostridium grantii DSM 8605 TaxID=1121316 RepID=A0A1M5SNB1_9CLOT|nr:SAM-dependent methyltransferase [Clostridium grantii]SHH40017.1 Methyltransferase domain-containing protein [Clostridium grantii DSM 8605]